MKLSSKAAKGLGAGSLFFTVFALSAGCSYFLLPKSTVVEHDKAGFVEIPEDHEMTNKERFISKLANSAANGLSIVADELVFEFDGKNETITENNEVVATVEHINRIDASGTTIDFALNSLSLQGINLALTAPITYTDAGERAQRRGIHASLFEHMLYLNLFDWSKEDADEVTYNRNWDFKYKVDLSDYDVLDKDGNPEVDPITGGIRHYEYGKLDWLIEDILAILSDGGIDLSLQGWLDNLMGSSSEESSSEEPAASSSSGMDMNALLASMDNMVEYQPNADEHYFIWNLDLGSMQIPLGLRGDANLTFTGVDLPSRYVADEEGVVTPNEAKAWEIQEGLRLNVSATINEFGEDGRSWANAETLVPGDVENYLELQNSRYLFEAIASYVAKPQFGVDVTLDLGYSSEGKDGDRTHVAKEASSDSIRVALSADADLLDRKFHGAGGQLSLQKLAKNQNEELEIVARHDVNVSYLYDQQTKEGNGFLDINGDLFKARTTKTYLDEFYSKVLKDAFSSGSSTSEKAEGENTLNQVREILNKIGLSIDSIMDSAFLTDLDHGVYVSALDFISSIRSYDNQIVIELSLAPIGLEGKITLTLSGSIDLTTNELNKADLLDIEIEGVKFAAFTLNGSIKTRAYHELAGVDSYDESYVPLSHLQGIGEQVTDIIHEKAFGAKLSVELGNEEKTDLSVDGDIAMSFNDVFKSGKVDLRLNQGLTDMIVPNHRVALDLADGFDTVAFAYASSANADSLDQLPEDALKAKLSFGSFSEIASSLLDRVDAIDDRFSRLITSLTSEGSASLLSRVTGGEVSALLEETDLLKSGKIHDENGDTVVVVNGAKLGLEGDLTVKVTYKANTEEKEGGIEALVIELPLSEKALNVRIDSIAAKEVAPLEENDETFKDEFRNFESVESFKDISFAAEILDYAVGSLTLGTTASNEGVSGISYYGLAGDLSVQIGRHPIKVSLFDAYASVEGAETKIYASLGGIPVIRGVNGPDSDIYFRPNEAEGVRTSEFYYYANGVNPDGEVLLTRDSSYGKVRNVRDGVRLGGEQFMDGILGWLGRYSLGICDSLLDKDEAQNSEPKAKVKGRAGLLGDEALRIETVVNGLSKNTVNGVDNYVISVNLGALLGLNVLGNADITLSGQTVLRGDTSFKTLTGLNIHADASAKASNNDSKLSIASVDVDLYLNNIKNGVMENVWEEGYPTANFANNFVGNVADDGILTASSKGLLFDLPGDQFNNLEGKETAMYGYYFLGQENIKPSNLYRGL